MLRLEFENQVKKVRVSEKIFLVYFKRAEKVLSRLPKFKGKMKGTVMLSLVDEKEIQAFNKEYRGVDKPTDVLSFSYLGEEKFPGKMENENVAGEIMICVSIANTQSKQHEKTLEEELQFLFLHGLLHVFGYDHIEAAERKEMFDLQDKIIGNKSWRKIADLEAEEEY